MRTNKIASSIVPADGALWKIQVAAMPQRLLESHDQAKKRGAKSRGLRVNHVDDVSRTLSRKSWQQKNFRG